MQQKIIDLRTGNEITSPPPCVLCLGTFDGVHIGHSALIAETLRQKSVLREKYPDTVGGAWCFSLPPADFLFDAPTPHITTLDQKLELFSDAGLDIAIIGDFPSLRDVKKETFVKEILKERCRCIKSVCGFDFRFGKNAEGGPSELEALPLGNITVEPVLYDGIPVSSSEIRNLIKSGELDRATRMLGRPYSVTLPIMHGKTLGRKLGAPTANQQIPPGILVPKHGVYATKATVGGITYPAITNVGTNPTVSDSETVKAETHILGFCGDIYGNTLKIEFMSYIRGEKKFSSRDELAAAISEDITRAKEYFNN